MKADRFLRALARLVLQLFFRRVEVAGAERVPQGRPLVVVANHVNGLVDPVLIVGALDLHPLPRLLAKSTLWKNPFVRPWLELAGALPVYRRQDQVDTSQNEEMFARSHDLLGAGGIIALFPEGTSHNDPALKPLRTGAARIVLGAEKKHPGLGARILPVGFLFDAKHRFRSRTLVQIGEPIDPAPELAMAEADPVAAARTLINRVDAALREVTLNYASWDDAALIARAADLGPAYHRGPEGPDETFAVQRAFLEGAEDLRERHPDRIAALAEAVRAYDRRLDARGLRDGQVAAAYHPIPVARFVVHTLLRLLVHLPLAVVGIVLNWPVYRLVGLIANPLTRRSPDQTATYKVFGSLLLFPLAWLAEALLAGRSWGPWAGLATFLIAPLTGDRALLFNDTRSVFWREARAYLLLRTRPGLAGELRTRREAILREVEDLAALYGAETRR